MTIDTGIKNHDLWTHPEDTARIKAAERALLQEGPLAKLDAWLARTSQLKRGDEPSATMPKEAPLTPQVDVWAA